MLKQDKCPVCEGYRRLKGTRKISMMEDEYNTECWACRGSGTIWYGESPKLESLKTIVPGGKADEGTEV